MHHIHLLQGADFKINVESDNILLHGTAEESAGVLLRGSVVLDCHEDIKIRSIVLKFIGKVKTSWIEGFGRGPQQSMFRDEKTILEHEWSFLPHTKKVYHLTDRHYRWDFELPLPGDLPESIQHDLGQVEYRLKAVAERPTFAMNWTDKRNLTVTRVMLPSSLELQQQIDIANEWADKLTYEFAMPRKCYSPNSLIPITFRLVPIAPNLQIRSISCLLKEYVSLAAGDHGKTFSQLIRQVRDDHLSLDDPAAHWDGSALTKTITLAVPPSEGDHKITCDTTNDLIKVRHKIKVEITLVNQDGHISELRAALPVMVSAMSNDDAGALPAYEDTWKSIPYDPDTFARMVAEGMLPTSLVRATPNEAASLATQSVMDEPLMPSMSGNTTPLPSPRPAHQESTDTPYDPLPWQALDLSRVPSYTTACRTNRLYSFSGSLPTYESAIAIPGQARPSLTSLANQS
ncbi:hypothetical protein DM01DRAFT_1309175 [Hesseltinella vesiculosa]|uniref:Arrestin C-terminal-like domain-containing protein n=1 Tax=Hesseltinella vesiculosa TaxID=101127 RepID=A0A1X2GAF1_9FUNG|nr:hypothetical protein DM01DRAFT_1309175 [Hesseltinella vesiculosa]